MTEEQKAQYAQLIEAGYTQQQAEARVGIRSASAPAAERPPQPDGWPGWRWDPSLGMWRNDHDRGGHEQWKAGAGAVSTAQYAGENRPTIEQMEDQGYRTDNIWDTRAGQRDPNVIAGQTRPTVDQGQIVDARRVRDAALDDQRRVLASVLTSVDPVAQEALRQRYQERGLAAANTLAANARGGAGAVSAARMQVNQQMPQIAAQAADAARQDQQAAFQAATGISNVIGQTATSAFGQEAGLATDTARIGLEAIDRVIADTGQQITADLQQQQLLGDMLTDISQLGLQYDSLDVETQLRIFDQIAKSNQISQEIAGQIKIAAKQNEKGVMDYVMGALGAAEGGLKTAGGLGWKPLA